MLEKRSAQAIGGKLPMINVKLSWQKITLEPGVGDTSVIPALERLR